MNKFSTRKVNKLFSLFFLFLLAANTFACNSKELSRSKAEALIKESAEFNYPAVIELKRANENEALYREINSDSETIEETKVKDLNGYLQDDPQLAVVNFLGLITIEQTLMKEMPKVGNQVPATRYFVTKFRANDKSKTLWKEMGLNSTDEAIPIAAKQFLTISGITEQGENQAVADFTCKFVPNSLGKTFEPNRTEFKSLPLELQKQILGETGQPPRDRRADWSDERKGKAFFQKYDDGWRLMRIVN